MNVNEEFVDRRLLVQFSSMISNLFDDVEKINKEFMN